jgi:hypothetical protein
MPSLNSQYGNLAAMAGISLPNSTSENRGDVAIATLKSRDFFKYLYETKDILPSLYAVDYYDKNTKKIVFKSRLFDINANKWIENPPTYIKAYKVYANNLNVVRDKLTGFVSVSYIHPSPVFAKEFLDLIIKELNIITRDADLKIARDSLDYLNDQLLIYNQADIKKSINALIEGQLQKQMIASIRSDYILSEIDSPYSPISRSSPNRKLITLLGFLLGLTISITYILVNYAFKNSIK